MAERIIAADGALDKALEGSEGDFLREGLQGFVQRLNEAEVAEVSLVKPLLRISSRIDVAGGAEAPLKSRANTPPAQEARIDSP